MTLRYLLVITMTASLTMACDSGSGPNGEESTGTDSTAGTDGSDITDMTDASPVCDDTSAEDFLVLFGYRFKVPGMNRFDINMMYPVPKFEPVNLTEFSLEKEGKTCEWGCSIDENIEWIAVNGSQPDINGFDFQMGRFNDCLEVSLVKGAELADKAHFAFAKNYIYYSEKVAGCTGPSCQYAIYRLNLEMPSERDLLIPFFPPAEDPDWADGASTFKGRFTVSPDGESIILLSPTIRSQRVYIWTKGTLHQVEYLCENFQNNTCIGAGSQFSDTDPVAVSPDSSTVLLFSQDDRALRVRRYSTSNLDDKGQSALLTVNTSDGSSYESVACALKEDWQFTEIVGTPRYTPDGQSVILIGRSACGSGEKAHTDLYKIDPSWIGDLTPVEEHELVNLTNNPTGDVPSNHEITAMTLSPDGKRIIFTATPHLSSNWAPMNDSDNRQVNDREVFVMSICGGDPVQLTSDVSYEASSPAAIPVPDFGACPVEPISPPM